LQLSHNRPARLADGHGWSSRLLGKDRRGRGGKKEHNDSTSDPTKTGHPVLLPRLEGQLARLSL
jgi:hypothetical protein